MGEASTRDGVIANHEGGEMPPTVTLYSASINGQDGFFGPVITSVPTGEDTGELWDPLAWLAARSDFCAYKRSRK